MSWYRQQFHCPLTWTFPMQISAHHRHVHCHHKIYYRVVHETRWFWTDHCSISFNIDHFYFYRQILFVSFNKFTLIPFIYISQMYSYMEFPLRKHEFPVFLKRYLLLLFPKIVHWLIKFAFNKFSAFHYCRVRVYSLYTKGYFTGKITLGQVGWARRPREIAKLYDHFLREQRFLL